MGYFISFGLLYIGYCLFDWGHYVVKHEKVPFWYLMSGQGDSGDLNVVGKVVGPVTHLKLGTGNWPTAGQVPTKANNPMQRPSA